MSAKKPTYRARPLAWGDGGKNRPITRATLGRNRNRGEGDGKPE